MKKALLLLVIAILLPGCNLKNVDYELTKDFLFQKNLACSGLRGKLDQDAASTSSAFGVMKEVKVIFYSPRQNSCLYTKALTSSSGDIKDKTFTISETEFLIDAYTGEQLSAVHSCETAKPGGCGKSFDEADEEMNKRIQEYKSS